jgi:hypothetical protein
MSSTSDAILAGDYSSLGRTTGIGAQRSFLPKDVSISEALGQAVLSGFEGARSRLYSGGQIDRRQLSADFRTLSAAIQRALGDLYNLPVNQKGVNVFDQWSRDYKVSLDGMDLDRWRTQLQSISAGFSPNMDELAMVEALRKLIDLFNRFTNSLYEIAEKVGDWANETIEEIKKRHSSWWLKALKQKNPKAVRLQDAILLQGRLRQTVRGLCQAQDQLVWVNAAKQLTPRCKSGSLREMEKHAPKPEKLPQPRAWSLFSGGVTGKDLNQKYMVECEQQGRNSLFCKWASSGAGNLKQTTADGKVKKYIEAFATACNDESLSKRNPAFKEAVEMAKLGKPLTWEQLDLIINNCPSDKHSGVSRATQGEVAWTRGKK